MGSLNNEEECLVIGGSQTSAPRCFFARRHAENCRKAAVVVDQTESEQALSLSLVKRGIRERISQSWWLAIRVIQHFRKTDHFRRRESYNGEADQPAEPVKAKNCRGIFPLPLSTSHATSKQPPLNFAFLRWSLYACILYIYVYTIYTKYLYIYICVCVCVYIYYICGISTRYCTEHLPSKSNCRILCGVDVGMLFTANERHGRRRCVCCADARAPRSNANDRKLRCAFSVQP